MKIENWFAFITLKQRVDFKLIFR